MENVEGFIEITKSNMSLRDVEALPRNQGESADGSEVSRIIIMKVFIRFRTKSTNSRRNTTFTPCFPLF